jgi:hypothetical protein
MSGGGKPDTDFVAAYLRTYRPSTKADVEVRLPLNTQPSGVPQFAYRNNNPGNLRYAGQPGATLGDGGFARFRTPAIGYQALVDQIQKDQRRGWNIAQFIGSYAPPEENDTPTYIRQVSAQLGVPAEHPISFLDPHALARAIAAKESGAIVSAPKPPF